MYIKWLIFGTFDHFKMSPFFYFAIPLYNEVKYSSKKQNKKQHEKIPTQESMMNIVKK